MSATTVHQSRDTVSSLPHTHPAPPPSLTPAAYRWSQLCQCQCSASLCGQPPSLSSLHHHLHSRCRGQHRRHHALRPPHNHCLSRQWGRRGRRVHLDPHSAKRYRQRYLAAIHVGECNSKHSTSRAGVCGLERGVQWSVPFAAVFRQGQPGAAGVREEPWLSHPYPNVQGVGGWVVLEEGARGKEGDIPSRQGDKGGEERERMERQQGTEGEDGRRGVMTRRLGQASASSTITFCSLTCFGSIAAQPSAAQGALQGI